VSDRLHDLHRQRDLVKQQLDWLDAEIARAASDRTVPTPTNHATPTNAAPAPRRLDAVGATHSAPDLAHPDEDALLAEFRAESVRATQQVRTGCWAAFAGALALLALVLFVWWQLRAD
jgi:hypothetical protein